VAVAVAVAGPCAVDRPRNTKYVLLVQGDQSLWPHATAQLRGWAKGNKEGTDEGRRAFFIASCSKHEQNRDESNLKSNDRLHPWKQPRRPRAPPSQASRLRVLLLYACFDVLASAEDKTGTLSVCVCLSSSPPLLCPPLAAPGARAVSEPVPRVAGEGDAHTGRRSVRGGAVRFRILRLARTRWFKQLEGVSRALLTYVCLCFLRSLKRVNPSAVS